MPSERLSVLTLKCANETYTIHQCTQSYKWEQLEQCTRSGRILELVRSGNGTGPPNSIKILVSDFNALIVTDRRKEKEICSYTHIKEPIKIVKD